MVRPEGVEPSAFWSEARRSIQLSYERIISCVPLYYIKLMKKNIFNTVVPSNFNNHRIDKFLHLKISEISRTRLQALIHDGQVKLNNVIVNDPSKKIKNKD